MTQPPSFTPHPKRRRPGAGDAHPAGTPAPEPAAPQAPTPRPRPSTPAETPVVRESVQERFGESQRPVTSHDPDPSARQWKVGSDEPDQPVADPTPPSFAPRSAARRPALDDAPAEAPDRTTLQPPVQAAPPVYAPKARSRGYNPNLHPQDSAVYPTAGAQAPMTPSRTTFPGRGNTDAGAQGSDQQARPRRRRLRAPRALTVVVVVLALVLGWPAYLIWDANRHLTRVDALSGAADTPGTTYLLAGSDSRGDGEIQDDTEGQRADSIVLINVAPNGQTSMVSLPRDTYVDIPGWGWNKLNASYAWGGAPLLVQTIEGLTGLTIDHYVEIGMGGVAEIVDAVGGVELCYDWSGYDEKSELNWPGGCQTVDGKTALAFARMRYSDPKGDIGRAERQRQVIMQTVKTALSPGTLLNPAKALKLERGGAGALTVDHDTGVVGILKLVLAFRSASGSGLAGAPPIGGLNSYADAGSVVELRDTTAPDFFAKMREGTLTVDDMNQSDY